MPQFPLKHGVRLVPPPGRETLTGDRACKVVGHLLHAYLKGAIAWLLPQSVLVARREWTIIAILILTDVLPVAPAQPGTSLNRAALTEASEKSLSSCSEPPRRER